MSYEPTNWQTGDIVTAAKLNHLEEGVAQGGGGKTPLFVHTTQESDVTTCDKTWQEINDAFMSGRPVIMDVLEDNIRVWSPIGIVTSEEMGAWEVLFVVMRLTFMAETPDGYPHYPYTLNP